MWNILVLFQFFTIIKNTIVNIFRQNFFLYLFDFSSCKPKAHGHNTVAINEVMLATMPNFPSLLLLPDNTDFSCLKFLPKCVLKSQEFLMCFGTRSQPLYPAILHSECLQGTARLSNQPPRFPHISTWKWETSPAPPTALCLLISPGSF